MIDILKQKGNVNDIADFMNMEDDQREKLLPDLTNTHMVKLAEACNRYPSLDLAKVESNRVSPQEVDLQLVIKRDLDPEDFENEDEFKEELKTFSASIAEARATLLNNVGRKRWTKAKGLVLALGKRAREARLSEQKIELGSGKIRASPPCGWR